MNTWEKKAYNRQVARSFNDAPSEVDLEKSITEMRQIYSSMTESAFCRMYESKYRVKAHDVASILERTKKRQHEG